LQIQLIPNARMSIAIFIAMRIAKQIEIAPTQAIVNIEGGTRYQLPTHLMKNYGFCVARAASASARAYRARSDLLHL
jgi:hypothetical protein